MARSCRAGGSVRVWETSGTGFIVGMLRPSSDLRQVLCGAKTISSPISIRDARYTSLNTSGGGCAFLYATKLISHVQLQRAFRDLGAHVLGARLDYAIACFNGNRQRELLLTDQHQRIDALIDRALNKTGDKRVRDGIYAFKVHALDFDVAVNDLLRLIEL